MIPLYLSVIIPAHNEERRLERCIESLIPHIEQYKHEIILVDNGSVDRTPAIVDHYSRIYPHTRAIHLKERGKGLAVKSGMLSAGGRYRYMCDVDLSTPAKEIHRFIEYARRYDVVIGSREIHPETTRTALRRRLMGRAWHWLVSDLVPGIRDTQCGFKMFRDYAADAIFENVTIVGMAFDVEALHLAHLLGYTMKEIAVPWVNDADSRVRMVDDSLEMLYAVSKIKPFNMNILRSNS